MNYGAKNNKFSSTFTIIVQAYFSCTPSELGKKALEEVSKE